MSTFIASMSNYMLYFSYRRPGGCGSEHGPECLSLLTSVLGLPRVHTTRNFKFGNDMHKGDSKDSLDRRFDLSKSICSASSNQSYL